MTASWAAVRGDVGGSGGVGGEEVALGAGEAIALFGSTAFCGSEYGSSGVGGDEMELGAEAGEEWPGVREVGVGGRCGESDRENSCSGVGDGVGLGGGGDQAGRGSMCSWGETQVVIHPIAPQQLYLAAPFCRLSRTLPGRGRWGWRGFGWLCLGRWQFGRQGLGPDRTCTGQRLRWQAVADRINEGVVCGGVSRLRRWRLEFGTLARFLGVLQSC
jgi:hypothetical protein